MQIKNAAITSTLVGASVLMLAGAGLVLTLNPASAQEAFSRGTESDFVQRFSGKLGVSEDDFCSSRKETQLDMLDERAKENDLDSDRVAEIRQRIEESDCGSGPRGRNGEGESGQRGPVSEEARAEMAEFLGMSADELEAAHDDGKNIREIAEDQGISDEDLEEFMEEHRPEGRPEGSQGQMGTRGGQRN